MGFNLGDFGNFDPSKYQAASQGAAPVDPNYDASGAPVLRGRDTYGGGSGGRHAYSGNIGDHYGRVLDYAEGGGDISGYKAPEQMFGGSEYRDIQAGAMEDWEEIQRYLPAQAIEHTQGYTDPTTRGPRPPAMQLPTSTQGIQPVKPISKGMDYLQSIQPRAPAGGNGGGGSTLMSQALRSQGSSGGGSNG